MSHLNMHWFWLVQSSLNFREKNVLCLWTLPIIAPNFHNMFMGPNALTCWETRVGAVGESVHQPIRKDHPASLLCLRIAEALGSDSCADISSAAEHCHSLRSWHRILFLSLNWAERDAALWNHKPALHVFHGNQGLCLLSGGLSSSWAQHRRTYSM